MAQQTVEERVNTLVLDILRGDPIEEAFSGSVQPWNREYCLDCMKKLWMTLGQDAHELALKTFIQCVYSQSNGRRSKCLLELLEGLVANNIVPSKLVCDGLLNCEKLDYHKVGQWQQTFQLIRKIIGGVDYKGCRDLLRVILDKSHMIPVSDNVSSLQQIDAVLNVIKYILDRNACLLPSYFAVNEITKMCPDDKTWPHWKMGAVLSEFIQNFRPAAQMVTIIGRTQLLPVVGHSSSTSNVWRLNQNSLRFFLSGPLPYDKELMEPQTNLLRYVLEQPYSRDMVSNMLGLTKQAKQRCEVLEEQIVDLVVLAMERSEMDASVNDAGGLSQLLWQNLSSQLIYFVLFQFANFPHMVLALYEKLQGKNLKKGRDHLMWVLLQFISGSIQKNPLSDFLPVLKLYDLLYSDDESIPIPDINKAHSTHAVASTCIWIHLNKKAQVDKVRLQRPIPHALKEHLEFLVQTNNCKTLSMNDYRIALLCNAYSTNNEFFTTPMGILVESIYGNGKSTTLLPGNIVASAPTQPLPMNLLDSLTVHAKMSLIHSIVTRVLSLAKKKINTALAPALVETYSRLLVYMEIESLGIKGFISQLLPSVFSSNAWGILHTLLEMFSYRLHHTQPHYRVQLLGNLLTLASVPHTNQNQLHLCVESTALRLITGLGSSEVQPQLQRVFNEPSKGYGFISTESEELNRALVLTLSRAMHVTGAESFSANWSKDILVPIMANTPHGWSSHTLACFPPSIAEFFQQNPVVKEDKASLKRNVETEYKKWKSMAHENDIIAHFSMQGTPPLFLCIIWKNLLDDSRVPSTAYKVLDRLGPRALSSHLRTFADFLVFEFATSAAHQHSLVNRYMDALNDMVWKCNIITIDRLILTLVLRNLDGNDAQVCYFIVQLLLLKSPHFRTRVIDFVKENSPDHWLQSDWHDKHMNFHRKYPEKFFYEGIQDLNSPNMHQYLPVYFGNVCLRFLPVLDIVIHRFIELVQVVKSLENILEHMGPLYKFHDRPITYLYNTLHCYERYLSEAPALKRKLVQAIIGAHKDIKPANWCLSEEYQNFLVSPMENLSWQPEPDYYVMLIGRLVDTIQGKNPSPFPNSDWRFNEFPNPASHALHATCIELMALPVASKTVGEAILDVIRKSCSKMSREKTSAWLNAVGLILTALPEPFWKVLNDRIIEVMCSPLLTHASATSQPFQMFDFTRCHAMFAEQHCSYMLAVCHAVWQHASIGCLSLLPQFNSGHVHIIARGEPGAWEDLSSSTSYEKLFIREKLRPIIQTENQFLYLCHLVGPFLQRFQIERTRCLLELTVELYEILQNVDKTGEHLRFLDPISDFLYHIKYMFVGDGVKNEVEKIIRTLRPALQMRLRYISHTNVEETMST